MTLGDALAVAFGIAFALYALIGFAVGVTWPIWIWAIYS